MQIFHSTTGRRLIVAIAFCVATLVATPQVSYATEPVVPELVDFGYINPMANYFVFMGTVVDDCPEACTVVFGENLYGYYTNVDSDGNFYLVLDLQPSQFGFVSAIIIDGHGNISNERMTLVYN